MSFFFLLCLSCTLTFLRVPQVNYFQVKLHVKPQVKSFTSTSCTFRGGETCFSFQTKNLSTLVLGVLSTPKKKGGGEGAGCGVLGSRELVRYLTWSYPPTICSFPYTAAGQRVHAKRDCEVNNLTWFFFI